MGLLTTTFVLGALVGVQASEFVDAVAIGAEVTGSGATGGGVTGAVGTGGVLIGGAGETSSGAFKAARLSFQIFGCSERTYASPQMNKINPRKKYFISR